MLNLDAFDGRVEDPHQVIHNLIDKMIIAHAIGECDYGDLSIHVYPDNQSYRPYSVQIVVTNIDEKRFYDDLF